MLRAQGVFTRGTFLALCFATEVLQVRLQFSGKSKLGMAIHLPKGM
jgi:hypothetical protein